MSVFGLATLYVIWKEVVTIQLTFYYSMCLEELSKAMKTPQRLAIILDKILAKHLPNTTQEFCHYGNLFGVLSVVLCVLCVVLAVLACV
jgi:hypothetical protein